MMESLYRYAMTLLANTPHHDRRADAEDLVHDCIVNALGKMDIDDRWPGLVRSRLSKFLRFEANGKNRFSTRHYGLMRAGRGGDIIQPPERLDHDFHFAPEAPTPQVDPEFPARLAEKFNSVCRAWRGKELALWAWVLYRFNGYTLEELAKAAGFSRQRAHQVVSSVDKKMGVK